MRLHQSGDPSYEMRIISIKGADWYDDLRTRARGYVKVNKSYYEDVHNSLLTLKE